MTSTTDLTPRQRNFVKHYITLGGVNAAQAATLAGYSNGDAGGRGSAIAAYRLLRNPAILAEIRVQAEKRLQSNVGMAAQIIEDLARNAKNEGVKLKAAEALLDRGGMMMATISRHEVAVIHKRSDDELRARVEQLAKELGLAGRVIEHRPAATPPVPAIEGVEAKDGAIDVDPDPVQT